MAGMLEVFNSQEIFCHLRDYRLKRPSTDGWQSILRALRVWIDCWFSGSAPGYKIKGKQLDVVIDDDYQIRMVEDEKGLQILCTEEGQEGMTGDTYDNVY